MNGDDANQIASKVAKAVYDLILENWDSVMNSGRIDPQNNGMAKITLACQISTLNSGNHTVGLTIPFRPVKQKVIVTPSDPGLVPDPNPQTDPGDLEL